MTFQKTVQGWMIGGAFLALLLSGCGMDARNIDSGPSKIQQAMEETSCTVDSDCSKTQYCRRPHCAAKSGTCEERPLQCPTIWKGQMMTT
ncbi:MAG: hypothetical protein EP343_02400 [Deltaproteobacteria bacterium]|nr:MAG: hypothetical protein EP343_02400 [Deltaproteobacteria bacterium]